MADDGLVQKKAKSDLHDDFEKIGTAGRKLTRCRYCYQFPEIVKRSRQVHHGKIPGLCTERGIKYSKDSIDLHVNTDHHRECIKAYNLSKLPLQARLAETTIGLLVSAENKKAAHRVGSHMMDVYNDAKRGTLSAFSWPSRKVAQMIGHNLNLDTPFSPYRPDIQLQYVNQQSIHLIWILLSEQILTSLQARLSHSLAVSMRVDGSVDKSQSDNKFVMLKIIDASGSSEYFFLDTARLSQPSERKAKGYLDAVKAAAAPVISWEELAPLMTSIVTDGESLNAGERGGLWALLRNDRSTNESTSRLPLVTIWCAAHRANPAFKSVVKTVPEVKSMLQMCTDLATFFHHSGVRTSELKHLADLKKLPLKNFPETFEVRFAEHTYDLLESILHSLEVLLTYFSETSPEDSVKRKGLLAAWTEKDFVRGCCVMRDCLSIFKRFQKHLQSDSLILTDIEVQVSVLRECLERVLSAEHGLTGGREEKFCEELQKDEVDGAAVWKWKGFQFICRVRRGRNANLFVSERRDFRAVQTEIIKSLINFVEERMSLDTAMLTALKQLTTISAETTSESLKNARALLVPDFSLEEFALEYRELAHRFPDVTSRQAFTLAVAHPEWVTLKTALARFLAATPHSCDVERLISKYNLLKDSLRSNLSHASLRKYLYISFNMPVVGEYDVRPAVRLWITEKERRPRETPPSADQDYYNEVSKKL